MERDITEYISDDDYRKTMLDFTPLPEADVIATSPVQPSTAELIKDLLA